jgi:diacylglycerol kinase
MQNPVKGNGEPAANAPGKNGTDGKPVEGGNQESGPYMRSESVIASFGYAYEGARYAFRTQRNVKLHCVITLLVILVGVLLRISLDQWTELAVVVGLVFQTELTNTALEAIVDRVSPEYHTLSKVAKDCSAAAVLVTAIAAVIAGVLIFLPHILALLGIG